MAHMNWDRVRVEARGRPNGWDTLGDPGKNSSPRRRLRRPAALPPREDMKCRKCGTKTTRKTHDGPKPGKLQWYAWWFRCPACGWMFMPKEAVRHVDSAVSAASPFPTKTDVYRHQDAGDDGRAPW